MGKIIAVNYSRGFYIQCSGTLIANNLLITAAHCLYLDAKGTEEDQSNGLPIVEGSLLPQVEHMYFIPAARYGTGGTDALTSIYEPYGALPIVRTWAAPCYAAGSWYEQRGECDYGLAEIGPYSDGTYAGQYTGTFPIMTGYSASVGTEFYLVGYPSAGLFSEAQHGYGNEPFFCKESWGKEHAWTGDGTAGSLYSLTGSGYYLGASGCHMTAGASGGPVFAHDSSGNWYVVGVNNIGGSEGGLGTYMAWNYWYTPTINFVCATAPGLCSG